MIKYAFLILLLLPVQVFSVFRVTDKVNFNTVSVYNPASLNLELSKLYIKYDMDYLGYNRNNKKSMDTTYFFMIGGKIFDISAAGSYNKIIEYENFKRELNFMRFALAKKLSFFNYGISVSYINGNIKTESLQENFNDIDIVLGIILSVKNLKFYFSYKNGMYIDRNIQPNTIRNEWFNSVVYDYKFIKVTAGINYSSAEYYRNLGSYKINKEVVPEAITYFLGSKINLSSVEFFQEYYTETYEAELFHIMTLGLGINIAVFKDLPVKLNLSASTTLNTDLFFKVNSGLKILYGGMKK